MFIALCAILIVGQLYFRLFSKRKKTPGRSLLHRSRDAIQMVEHMEAPGENVVEHACTPGLEGIMSKRRDAPYRHSRCRTCLKVKKPESPAALRVWG